MSNKPQLKDLDLASKYELDNNYTVIYKDIEEEFTPPTRIGRKGDVYVTIDGYEYYNHEVVAELYKQTYHPVPAEVDTRVLNDYDYDE